MDGVRPCSSCELRCSSGGYREYPPENNGSPERRDEDVPPCRLVEGRGLMNADAKFEPLYRYATSAAFAGSTFGSSASTGSVTIFGDPDSGLIVSLRGALPDTRNFSE